MATCKAVVDGYTDICSISKETSSNFNPQEFPNRETSTTMEDDETVEVRCLKKYEGWMEYEVILAEPVAVTRPELPSSSSNRVSWESLKEKWKAADERRLSLEAKNKARVAAMLSRREEMLKKKKELANNSISQTQEALEQNMEAHTVDHERRAELVRQNKRRLSSEGDEQQERLAKLVRQNKGRLSIEGDEQQTASSG